jgi:hypothetical protein
VVVAGFFGYHSTAITYVDDTIWTTYGICTSYDFLGDEYYLDSQSKHLQNLSIFTAGFGTIFLLVTCCCFGKYTATPRAWKNLGFSFLILCILQGCTLALLRSSICTDNPYLQYLSETKPIQYQTLEDPDHCQTSTGYNLNIAATVFWFLASISSYYVASKTTNRFEDDDDEQQRKMQNFARVVESTRDISIPTDNENNNQMVVV